MTLTVAPLLIVASTVLAAVAGALLFWLRARARKKKHDASVASARAAEEERRRRAAAVEREAVLAHLAARREALVKRREEASLTASAAPPAMKASLEPKPAAPPPVPLQSHAPILAAAQTDGTGHTGDTDAATGSAAADSEVRPAQARESITNGVRVEREQRDNYRPAVASQAMPDIEVLKANASEPAAVATEPDKPAPSPSAGRARTDHALASSAVTGPSITEGLVPHLPAIADDTTIGYCEPGALAKSSPCTADDAPPIGCLPSVGEDSGTATEVVSGPVETVLVADATGDTNEGLQSQSLAELKTHPAEAQRTNLPAGTQTDPARSVERPDQDLPADVAGPSNGINLVVLPDEGVPLLTLQSTESVTADEATLNPEAANGTRPDGTELGEEPSPELTEVVTSVNGGAVVEALRQRRYRAPSRNPAQARPSRRREPSRTVERGAPVDVRLTFERGGGCSVSLVLRRPDAMPPRLTVAREGGSLELVEMQEGWYEDVFIEDLGEELTSGISWEGRSVDGQQFRWSLGGRDVFVLAAHAELNGFVDTNRLVLNENNVVLCTQAMEDEVLTALDAAGASAPRKLTGEQGAPRGWIVLRDVIARRAVEAPEVADALNCLRPAANAELVLAGGIRLQPNAWLSGFPPSIRIKGDAALVREVLIDGQVAAQNPDGSFQTESCDKPGPHFVATSIGNSSYTIVEPEHDWSAWAAHNWTLGEDEVSDATLAERPSVCGAMVIPPAARKKSSRSAVVPLTNALLIGAAPGEIEICKPLGDRTSKQCVGFPSFQPVWALPVDALHCDRRSTGVILLAPTLVSAISPTSVTALRAQRAGVRAWCSAILSASRKGLAPIPTESAVAELWSGYRDAARSLRRRLQ
ncbi:MAG: hypothetical protein ACREX4_01715 [Gammaproteobacteria bacterium]